MANEPNELPPTAQPPKPTPPAKASKRRLPNRVPRRPEENEARADYVSYLIGLGPREGESFLAFWKRLYGVAGARELWVDIWRRHGNDRTVVAAKLGIPFTNLSNEMRAVGLTSKLLFDIIAGNATPS